MAAPRSLYYVRRFIVALSVAKRADDPTEYFAIYHHPLDPTSLKSLTIVPYNAIAGR